MTDTADFPEALRDDMIDLVAKHGLRELWATDGKTIYRVQEPSLWDDAPPIKAPDYGLIATATEVDI